jgi:CRISPR system Cascade subunit CasB
VQPSKSPPLNKSSQDGPARFIAALSQYAPDGAGHDTPRGRAALAALRRGLGKPAGAAAEMYPYVVPYLPATLSPRQEEAYFLIASLFALHPTQWHGDLPPWQTNLGASFHWLHNKRQNPSTEKRFAALLDAPGETLAYHLRQAVSLLKAEEIPVNYVSLLHDILFWDQESRGVQRQWARAFWQPQSTEADEKDTPGNGDQATVSEE